MVFSKLFCLKEHLLHRPPPSRCKSGSISTVIGHSSYTSKSSTSSIMRSVEKIKISMVQSSSLLFKIISWLRYLLTEKIEKMMGLRLERSESENGIDNLYHHLFKGTEAAWVLTAWRGETLQLPSLLHKLRMVWGLRSNRKYTTSSSLEMLIGLLLLCSWWV